MAHTDLCYLTIAEAAAGLRQKTFSAGDLTRACLERISAIDDKLHSFITLTGELALQQAAQADRELSAGQDRGPLHGIPDRAQRSLCHPRHSHHLSFGGVGELDSRSRRRRGGEISRGWDGAAWQTRHA